MSLRAVLTAALAAVCLTPARSESTPSARPHFDVLVLAPTTPVIVRVRVAFEGGATLSDNRRDYAQRWFERFDRDGDGSLSGEEAQQVRSFGRFSDVTGALGTEWRRLDTNPTDGHLSAEELLAHIDLAMGDPLVIQRARQRASQTVLLLPRLDVDDDGQVSADELAAGVTSLRPFDFDDDQSLSAAELQPFPRSMRVTPDVDLDTGQLPLVVLDESGLGDVATRLIRQYQGVEPQGSAARDVTTGESPDAGALGFETARLKALDRDSDGRLNEDELIRWLRDPVPDLEVSLQMPTSRPKRAAAEAVHRPEAVTIHASSSRRVLETGLGGVNVEWTIRDARSSVNRITSRYRELQFRAADDDRSKWLSPREFREMDVEDADFTTFDADADGRVTFEEFQGVVQHRALLAQCQLEMKVSNETTSLFEALDRDEDRRLSLREFAGSFARMRPLDRNGNGQLAETELVTKYTLTFTVKQPPEFQELQGSRSSDDMRAATRLPVIRPVTRGPEWFRKMDRNQDGDVTWREFLGPRSSFDRIDSDGNALIDADEAERSMP